MPEYTSQLIGIAGPSGAGKTTVCSILKSKYDFMEHIRLEDYFKSPETFPQKDGFVNWEVPKNLDFDLLRRHLRILKNGKSVLFKKILDGQINLEPKRFIIIEGFVLFRYKRIRDLFNIKIYLDIPPDLITVRRALKFGTHLKDYDEKVTIPEFFRYGLTQKMYADYVIDGSRPLDEVEDEVAKILGFGQG